MKKLFFILAVIAATSFTVNLKEKHHATVEIQPPNKLYVYYLSTPDEAYDSLGVVEKTGMVMSGGPEEMVNILMRRATKDYPDCDAIIILNKGITYAKVIKFKE